MTTTPTERTIDHRGADARPPGTGRTAMLRRDAIRAPLLAWLVSRSIIFASAIIGYAIFGFGGPQLDGDVHGPLTLLGTWDTSWYLGIAREGYTTELSSLGQEYSNVAFFPLVPGLLWTFDAMGFNAFYALLVLSNLAFLGVLVLFRHLAAQYLSPKQATLATWCFALFPPTLASSMAYTEALTLLLTMSAVWLTTRGRWGSAAGVAGIATLARPTGGLASLLVALLAWRPRTWSTFRRGLLYSLPGVAAIGGFVIYMTLTHGSATASIQAQGAWGRDTPIKGLFTAAWTNTQELWDEIVNWDPSGKWVNLSREVVAVILYIVLIRRLARMVPDGWRSPWVIYSALALAVPLSTGTFNSMARLGIVAFPLFWMIPSLLAPHGRIPARLWLGVSALLLAIETMHLAVGAP